MKSLWLLFLALIALLLIQTTNAEVARKRAVQEDENEKIIENKLLNQVETKIYQSSVDDNGQADDANDDGDVDEGGEEETDDRLDASITENEAGSRNIVDSARNKFILAQGLITEEDVAALKEQPDMHRLARRLRSFHNANALAGSNNFRQIQQFDEDEEDDKEAIAEERAIRRRKRVRRRKIKNKIKRTNRNKHVANRRKTSNQKSKNKNLRRRKSSKKSKGKRVKNRVRTKGGRGSNRRRGVKRKSSKGSKRKRGYSSKKRDSHLKRGRRGNSKNSYHNPNRPRRLKNTEIFVTTNLKENPPENGEANTLSNGTSETR